MDLRINHARVHIGKDGLALKQQIQFVVALLSPEIIHLAIIGALPDHIALKSLKAGLPADWEAQKKFLKIE